MKLIAPLVLCLIASNLLWCAPAPAEPRQMERLGRGVVAIRQSDSQVWISWRLLGTDPANTSFDVYRATDGGTPTKLNPEPLTGPTHFVDTTANLAKANAYTVRPRLAGQAQTSSNAVILPANSPARPYLAIPLRTPPGYSPNDASVGDLDGDGDYEIVLHQAGRARDNSQAGITDPPILQAYRLDGSFLWEINLGKNIRDGAHYTQFMVYDLDGDGRAEVVCKTADGTVDGLGKVIGDAAADYVSREERTLGKVLSGPEFLTAFSGLTGAALATVDYLPPRGDLSRWGDLQPGGRTDSTGNRSDRFLACVAYLDGVRPSVVMCRGYYGRATLAAWDWRDGKLTQRWFFDSDDGTPGNDRYRSQGNHQLSVADVDGDGRDEIIYGACVIDDNGKGLYSTGRGHGDAMHVSDLDPDRPGLEVFSVHEAVSDFAGGDFRDARTGEMLWSKPSPRDAGRGMSANIDPRHRGNECWSAPIRDLFNAKGEVISPTHPRSINFAVWWDGDLLRELLDRNYIAKWNWETGTETTLLTAEGCVANNGTKATPVLSVDLFGDWREEVIWRTEDNRELRIYTTTIPTPHRLFTLMHDPQYRLAIAWQNVAYNQPPHPSFYLDEATPLPPRPSIVTISLRPAAADVAPADSLTRWPAGAAPYEVGRRVAENFVGRKLRYETTTNPARAVVIYPEICAWYGALSVARLTGDQELQTRLVRKFDPLLTPEGAKFISPKAHVDFRVFGALPLELFIQTKEPRYLELGRNLANRQWENPTADGITAEARYWIDDMYMIPALQVQAFRATGEAKYLDRAALTMTAYLDKLQQPNGLFFHAPDSPFYWSRGNGWMAAGMTELLRELPAAHPQRARILAGYRTMLSTLLAHQGPDGLWRQLIDQPDFWSETSGTGMFTFAMVAGVKRGWLDAATYGPATRRAWLGLVGYLDANAEVREVCMGTNKSGQEAGPDLAKQLEFYRNRPRKTGDLHGQAPLLWTAAELLR
ncbi:MAG: glycoside hydrolase family 88 protein [Opitutae bacterium]|nr:glycoside hydrolase family 88 protein [Opitutae bacterium]